MPPEGTPERDLLAEIAKKRDWILWAARNTHWQQGPTEEVVDREKAAYESDAVRAVADKVQSETEGAGSPEGTEQHHAAAEVRVAEESAKYEVDSYAAQLKRISVETQRLQEDIELRREYASKAVNLAQAAVAFWFFLFGFAGVCNLAGKEFLSDTALIAFTTGATVNVIAVFVVVVKGLFPPQETKVSKTRKTVRGISRKS